MAEGGGLLNRYTLSRRIEGSNPSVSAKLSRHNDAHAHKPDGRPFGSARPIRFLRQIGNPIPREDRFCLYAPSTEAPQRPPQHLYKRERSLASQSRCLSNVVVRR